MEHEPASTSIEAAKIRNSELKQGAKALILRSKGEYLLLVTSAAHDVDFKEFRKVSFLEYNCFLISFQGSWI